MRPLAGFLAGGIVLLALLAPPSQAHALGGEKQDTAKPIAPSESVHHPRENTYMKRQWGVEVLFVRQTSAGYMLEFRYKVLDAKKAQALFERQTKPVLTHTKTGAKLIVPTPAKTGALRNSNPPIAGNTYWMFFANPGKLVKPGDTVSVEIGDFLVEKLIVE
jgi:hypothetical protein